MWAYVALAAAQLLGGYQQADMIRKNGQLKSSIDDMNAQFQEIDAYDAKNAGYSEASRYSSVVDSTVSGQRTALAANDVSVDYGTAKDVQADTKITGMLNTLELQRQGREKALGYKMSAINTRLGGQMTQFQANMDAASAQGESTFKAISTGISGYTRSQSTGTGQTSKSGTNSAPKWGSTAPAKQQPSWFFGTSPRAYANPSFSTPTMGESWKESWGD